MNYSKIVDVAKELQTDAFKTKVLKMIEQFVYRYQTHYHPKYKGDLYDLILDIYKRFTEPKKHRNGEVFSELDRVDMGKVGGGEWTGSEDKALATYIQRYVINRLIDMERQSAQVINVDENYNSESGSPTIDRVARSLTTESDDFNLADLIKNPKYVRNAKKTFIENPEMFEQLKQLARRNRKNIDPSVLEFVDKLISDIEGSTESELSKKLKSELDNIQVTQYPFHGSEAIRISFDSKEASAEALPKKDDIVSLLEQEGYEFYKVHGSNWYFIKK